MKLITSSAPLRVEADRSSHSMGFVLKLLIIMKLTTVIMLTFALQVSAKSFSQKVTIKGENLSLKEVFRSIGEQSGYQFIVSNNILKGKPTVDLNLESVDVEVALTESLKDKNLSFEITADRIVIIKSADSKVKPTVSDALDAPPVTGIVKGPDGQPLAGVNIVVKGTKRGTSSDNMGKFSINANEGDVLVFSSIAFTAKEIKVEQENELVVLMQLSASPLDEVQILAYGQTSKRFNTGNVNSVKGEEIARQPVQNPLIALQGRVPGLVVTQMTGVPGGGATVRLQGQNSIGSGNDPFYVIDGVPYVSQMLRTTNGVILGASGGIDAGSGNPLNYINPADIERIDILKDADATSIYGSRAANGAILITTKKGKAGAAKVEINLQHGFGQASRRLHLLNTPQYLEMRREALKNDGIAEPSTSDNDINGFWDTTRSTDWQKELIGHSAEYTTINGSISGGSSSVQYNIGATYNRQTSIFPGNFADNRGGVHFNINTASSNQKFRVQLTGNFLSDVNKLPSSDLTRQALLLAPTAPALYNSDGTLNWQPNPAGSSTWTNPLTYSLSNYENKTSNLIGNLTLDYQLAAGLHIKSSFGYNSLVAKEFTGYPITSARPESVPFFERSAYYSNSIINSWIIEPQLTYNKNLWKGIIDVLVGTTIQQRNNDGQNLTGTGHPTDAALRDIRSATDITTNSTEISQYRYNALFARVNYNLVNKYIINLSARRDGSSRFGPENQFHNFGAIGAAWIFTEEKFFRNNFAFLSFGKLRGSYGTTGNDQIADYQFLNLYNPNSYPVPYQGGSAIAVNRHTNPYLQWEETKKLQAGLDLGFIRDRILFTANYVRNRSSNQLLEYSLPDITGFGSITSNFPATVQNTAWEFSLNTVNLMHKNFTWKSNVNLTVPRNKLAAFPGIENSSYAYIYVVGQDLTATKLIHFLGVDDQTGVYIFSDKDGKATSTPDLVADRTVLMHTSPRLYGGFENTFNYKGLQLNVMFQFVKQNSYGAKFGYNTFQPGRRNSNIPIELMNRWRNPGDISTIQRFSSNLDVYDPYTIAQQSDANFQDGSFLRLKSLSLVYEFPAGILSNSFLKTVQLYLQAQNLLTITNFAGLDPETFLLSPPLRMVTFGLRAGL